MRLKALSRYGADTETRYGDCILLYDRESLVVYDCGHEKHAEEVVKFLRNNSSINKISIVVSHNDSDHINGIEKLLFYLKVEGCSITVFTSLYLKSTQKMLELLDDERRTPKATREHILEIFDNIKKIVDKATEYEFTVENATIDTVVDTSCSIVGPVEDDFIAVVARAIENEGTGQIDGETVKNAASIQLRCESDNGRNILLCGDASPDYLPDLSDYLVVQLPHHGKLSSAKAIFGKIEQNRMGNYTFLVSDNTGNTNGGSNDLQTSDLRIGKDIMNTNYGNPVEIGEKKKFATVTDARKSYGLWL